MRPRSSDIAICGAGYVGLVTGCGLAHLGHRVALYDTDRNRVETLQAGEAPFYEPGLSELLVEGISSGRLSFSSTPEEVVTGSKYIFIAVPTPMSSTGKANLTHLRSAIATIASHSNEKKIVVVKSTVPVGSFLEINEILKSKQRHDKIHLVSNPEFLAEGSAFHDFFNPCRTVIGSTDHRVGLKVGALYKGLPGKFIYTDPNTAQMIKYSANSFLATRIAFINEIAQLCEHLDIDVSNVSDALLMDPRLGNGYLTASAGFAGPCLPKDISALRATANQLGLSAFLLQSVYNQNELHLERVVERLKDTLNGYSSISIFGLSFKANTDDVRNSISIKIINEISPRVGLINATDPRANAAAQALLKGRNNIAFFSDPIECAKDTDLQIFLTPWSGYKALDLHRLRRVVRRPYIFDAMALFTPSVVAKAGFQYEGVGRRLRNGIDTFYRVLDSAT